MKGGHPVKSNSSVSGDNSSRAPSSSSAYDRNAAEDNDAAATRDTGREARSPSAPPLAAAAAAAWRPLHLGPEIIPDHGPPVPPGQIVDTKKRTKKKPEVIEDNDAPMPDEGLAGFFEEEKAGKKPAAAAGRHLEVDSDNDAPMSAHQFEESLEHENASKTKKPAAMPSQHRNIADAEIGHHLDGDVEN